MNNLADSLEFYSDVLGFEIESSNDRLTPDRLTEVGFTAHYAGPASRDDAKARTWCSFRLGVDDVDDFYERLNSRNVDVSEPRDEGWGGRFVNLQDPDGYRLFFVTWT